MSRHILLSMLHAVYKSPGKLDDSKNGYLAAGADGQYVCEITLKVKLRVFCDVPRYSLQTSGYIYTAVTKNMIYYYLLCRTRLQRRVICPSQSQRKEPKTIQSATAAVQ
jgi:hypothetical protein